MRISTINRLLEIRKRCLLIVRFNCKGIVLKLQFAYSKALFNSIVLLNLYFLNGSRAQVAEYSLVSQYNIDNGLPFTLVNQIHQDKDGLLWIATNQGLYKFDGRNFKNVPLFYNNSTNNTKPFVSSFGVLRNNLFATVWQNQSVLFKLNKGKSEHGKIEKGFFHYYDQFGIVDKSQIPDTFWREEFNKSLLKGNMKHGFYIQTPQKCLFFCKNKQYFNVGENANLLHSSVFIDSVYLTIEHRDNSYYLIEYKNGKLANKIFILGLENSSLSKNTRIFYSNEKLLLQSNGNVYQLGSIKDRKCSAKMLLKLPKVFVLNNLIFSNVDGSIIASSLTQGILIYGKRLFENIASNLEDISENPINIVYSFQPLAENRFLTTKGIIGTNSVKYLNHAFIQSLNIPKTKTGKIVYPVGNKMFVFDTFFTPLFMLPRITDARTIEAYTVSNEHLFLFSNKSVYIYNHNVEYIKKIETSITENVRFMHYEGNRIILCCFSNTYSLELLSGKLSKLKSLSHICVDNIVPVSGNLLCFLHSNGWGYLKNDMYHELPLDKDRILQSAHTAVEDNFGYIWISTNNGLFRLKTIELTNYIKSRVPFNLLGPYLNNVEFNGGCHPAGMRIERTIAFPSLSGLYILYPWNFNNAIKTTFWLDKIVLDNTTVSQYNLNLKPNFRTIKFLFDLPLFYDFGNYLLQYRLNENDSWSSVPRSLEIQFEKLEAGDYNLQVRLFDLVKAKTLITNNYNFGVNYFWYKNPYFFVIVIFFAIAILILLLYRQRVLYRKRQEVLEKIVEFRTNDLRNLAMKFEKAANFRTNLSQLILHDITSPLIFLKSLVEKIYKNSNQNKDYENLLSGINSLYRYSDNLTTWIKSQNHADYLSSSIFNLSVVFEELNEDYYKMAKQKDIRLEFYNKCDIDILSIRQVLLIIMRNLIDNSIKYSEKGYIRILGSNENGIVTIELQDTGIGMDANKVKQLLSKSRYKDNLNAGIGYQIIWGVIEKIQGKLDIQSTPNLGSFFILTFPVFLEIDAD